MFKLAPSILSADFCELGAQIDEIRAARLEYLHIDVMDGHFVPNISIGVPVVKSIRKRTRLTLDVHLMIENPERYIEAFADAGADIINFHIEAAKDPESLISQIRALGKRPAVTIKPGTDIEALYPYLDKLSMALIMSVEPGFGGQKLIPEALLKAEKLRGRLKETGLSGSVDIEMDGGINRGNLREVLESGVDIAVVGSALFRSENLIDEIFRFKAVGGE